MCARKQATYVEAAVDALVEEFEFLDGWEDRYGYIIDLGRTLEPMPDSLRTPRNKVAGCASQVWMFAFREPSGALRIVAYSDAHIVRGLIAILLRIFSGRSAGEILLVDALQVLRRLGLEQHLSPSRANGLHSMVQRIRALARASMQEER